MTAYKKTYCNTDYRDTFKIGLWLERRFHRRIDRGIVLPVMAAPKPKKTIKQLLSALMP